VPFVVSIAGKTRAGSKFKVLCGKRIQNVLPKYVAGSVPPLCTVQNVKNFSALHGGYVA
jgi:hypothetical protein